MTLLESQLEAIRATGIHDIVLVTGYRSAQIEAKIQYYDGFDFTVVYNPFYDVSNNLVSAWMAMPYIQSEFVLINGDDVFRPTVLERLLTTPGDLVMVVSKKGQYDEDDMKVHIEGESVQKVSKALSESEANGESIGMIKFSPKGREWFAAELGRMVRHKPSLDVFYLQAIQNLMDQGLPVRYSTCTPEEWAEIDFHPDLMLLKERIGQELLSWDPFPQGDGT